MSGGAVDVCGHCGAPLEPTGDGRCSWCGAQLRATQPRAYRSADGWPRIRWRWSWRLAAITAVAVGLAAGLGVGIASYADSHQSGPPAAAPASSAGVVGSVAPGSTDLQALKQDFGPWRQLTGQSTGSPGLLLLQGGSAYASEQWTVPPNATWWAPDLGGNVTSVQPAGGRAAITDADGTGYTVGINQAFIISSNPDTVLLISPGGTVMSMSLAQATAVRRSLRK